MNKKNDLELFYILPYTKKYNTGHHYYNDEICCNDYKDASFSIWYGDSLFFETEKQLLSYFSQNAHNPIPIIYRIRYMENFKGLDDIIQITNLGNNTTGFYTMLDKNRYAWFNLKISEFCGKNVWQDDILKNDEGNFRLKDMFEEFSKRGIKLKCNVLKKNIDKTKCFEFIGDPYYIGDAIQMKDKQLILYRQNPTKPRLYEIEELLKQYLPVEEVNRLLCEVDNPLQEIFFGQSGSSLTKKLTPPKQ